MLHLFSDLAQNGVGRPFDERSQDGSLPSLALQGSTKQGFHPVPVEDARNLDRSLRVQREADEVLFSTGRPCVCVPFAGDPPPTPGAAPAASSLVCHCSSPMDYSFTSLTSAEGSAGSAVASSPVSGSG
jgi:hypothetical protein